MWCHPQEPTSGSRDAEVHRWDDDGGGSDTGGRVGGPGVAGWVVPGGHQLVGLVWAGRAGDEVCQ